MMNNYNFLIHKRETSEEIYEKIMSLKTTKADVRFFFLASVFYIDVLFCQSLNRISSIFIIYCLFT